MREESELEQVESLLEDERGVGLTPVMSLGALAGGASLASYRNEGWVYDAYQEASDLKERVEDYL